ncbi:peptidylprolyl isomerase [Microbulbifer thermotolerans]|uniref:Peptidyl-prolyl cis-trans isomerase n=1 Tax=Microbulbifer thermotolerans TaxID=252514 RepID=A0A143HKE6_MICTH|nr:peptidylprolyl isomerase [Microbulbifer thermotolerans]AMX02199.1 peptidylprolyl isomerase [Microbulbifer thermotolerans]MCX2800900.1 peptidylprolyl isomerase [Microbulbifer thermotolerans]MCX2830245.1 peptidylprolyl isomerase [Microbulbifer thermotolerans]WKT61771.1 peptidylprolyl isomerase [Microbulbifer thermotolerans]
MRSLTALFLTCLLALPALADNPEVELKTDLGLIRVELFRDKAPATVENFLAYLDSGFYNGVIFHRVIPNFMVQTGGHTFDFQLKETREPVINESGNGLKNLRGTLAMARKSDPDSATSQFFINLKHNAHLDAQADKPGYTVFGRVIQGMDVVEKIVNEPRGLYRAFPNAPNVPIRILNARRADTTAVAGNTQGD